MGKNPTKMFDSVTLDTIPKNAKVVAGYVGGFWPTFFQLPDHFPHARHVSIAVSSGQAAEVLDLEHGDATPIDAPAWVMHRRAGGILRPCLYASLDTMPEVIAALQNAGYTRDMVRLWVAEYTGKAHIPAPVLGWHFDACQWTSSALGLNLDESLLADTFWPATSKRSPVVKRVVSKLHPKTAAAAAGGAGAAAIVALAHTLAGHAGPHLSTDEAAVLTAVVALVSSYLKSS